MPHLVRFLEAQPACGSWLLLSNPDTSGANSGATFFAIVFRTGLSYISTAHGHVASRVSQAANTPPPARPQARPPTYAGTARLLPRRLHRGDPPGARLHDRADGRDDPRRARHCQDRMVVGGRSIEIARVRITAAGRQALTDN